MTATATDTLTVAAVDKADAPDIARRQWESFGFRVLRIVEVREDWSGCVRIEGAASRWRVTADVEVRRA